MSKRITLKVRMRLLSDAIFSSGVSIPGAEDISVYTDESGYPYYKATSFKGMLRESIENLTAWTGAEEELPATLLGEEGWAGTADDRRIYVTDLKLVNPPENRETCFEQRAFTAMEDGIAKAGSLRMAACICDGLCFEGRISCSEEDYEFVKEAIELIRWVGTLRNRGFGSVKFTVETETAAEQIREMPACSCLKYVLRTVTPVQITQLNRSYDNVYEARKIIPGSVIRGMTAAVLSAKTPEKFEQVKNQLLSSQVRFLDAYPEVDGRPGLPSIKGFYEKKDGSDFMTVVRSGDFNEGSKRAGLGECCSLYEDTVSYMTPETASQTRILKKDRKMFETGYICAGQTYTGYIRLDTPELAPMIAHAFEHNIHIGADRYEGFGECEVVTLEPVEVPAYEKEYGYAETPADNELYMLLLSPMTMTNELGEPCGIDENKLAEALQVEWVKVLFCSTSVSDYGSFNRTWQARESSVSMYDAGSIFHLVCSSVPGIAAVRLLQREGIGLRRAEGFGSVLFLRRDLFENIKQKKEIPMFMAEQANSAACMRRERIRDIIQGAVQLRDAQVKGKLSSAQMSALHSVVNQTVAAGKGTEPVIRYLEDAMNRNVDNNRKYRELSSTVAALLSEELCRRDGMQERLQRISEMIAFSRKVRG